MFLFFVLVNLLLQGWGRGKPSQRSLWRGAAPAARAGSRARALESRRNDVPGARTSQAQALTWRGFDDGDPCSLVARAAQIRIERDSRDPEEAFAK